MSKPDYLLSRTHFPSFVREIFGEGRLSRMTRESHPEVMEFYSKRCQEAGLREFPVYLLDSDEYKGAYIFGAGEKVFLITSRVLREHRESPAAVCAIFGHEHEHLARLHNGAAEVSRTLSRRNALKKTLAAVTLPFAIREIDSEVRKKGVLPPDNDAESLAKTLTAVMLTAAIPATAVAGHKISSAYNEEYECDKGGASFAGTEAALSSLRAYDNCIGLTDRIKRIVTHPPFSRRMRRIEEMQSKENIPADSPDQSR